MYNDVVIPIKILFDVVERNLVYGCSVINKHSVDKNIKLRYTITDNINYNIQYYQHRS
jgi:hypothetical protein